jgi:hypothetical protein
MMAWITGSKIRSSTSYMQNILLHRFQLLRL